MSKTVVIFMSVSYLSLSLFDEENQPLVYSIPPRTDSRGNIRPSEIVVEPWGQSPTGEDIGMSDVTMYYSLEEAEAFGRKLLETALAAKGGVYSQKGHALVEPDDGL